MHLSKLPLSLLLGSAQIVGLIAWHRGTECNLIEVH